MNNIKSAVQVVYPDADFTDNFEFDTVHPDGVFHFKFQYFNEQWNGWATLPSGEIRAFGVLPQVPSWTGFVDYGIFFNTSLKEITHDELKNTELYIISWE